METHNNINIEIIIQIPIMRLTDDIESQLVIILTYYTNTYFAKCF